MFQLLTQVLVKSYVKKLLKHFGKKGKNFTKSQILIIKIKLLNLLRSLNNYLKHNIELKKLKSFEWAEKRIFLKINNKQF